MQLSPPAQTALMRIARTALLERLGICSSQPCAPAETELLQPAGCFVSLHEIGTHRLRGCIGRLDATQPLWQVVRETAMSVLGDPRFVSLPVTIADLPVLELEISTLAPPREAASVLDFEPLKDGIYLMIAGRAGFFLPQVAQQTGWTREQLLDRLCTEKMGLPAPSWRQADVKLLVFPTTVLPPEPLASR